MTGWQQHNRGAPGAAGADGVDQAQPGRAGGGQTAFDTVKCPCGCRRTRGLSLLEQMVYTRPSQAALYCTEHYLRNGMLAATQVGRTRGLSLLEQMVYTRPRKAACHSEPRAASGTRFRSSAAMRSRNRTASLGLSAARARLPDQLGSQPCPKPGQPAGWRRPALCGMW